MVVRASAVTRRREQARAWAHEVGSAHGLGECRDLYEAVHGRVTPKGCGGFLILAGVLGGIPIVASATGTLRVVLLCGVAVVIAGGFVLRRRPDPEEKADWIALFPGGIAQLNARETVPRVISWPQFGHLYLTYSDPYDDYGEDGPPDATRSIRDWTLQGIRVTAVDGTEIETGSLYDGRSLDRMRQELEETVMALRLRPAIDQYDSGAPVCFGHLSVSQEGIAWKDGAKRAAWEQIRSLRMWPYQLALTTGRLGGPVIPQAGVPDWCVVVELIREVAARRGISEQGRG